MTIKKQFPKKWILLRGLSRSTFHWLGFETEFKKFFDCDEVICLELAGNGYLFDQPSATSIDQAVEQLRKQIKNQPSPLGLCAISMGGMIATRWAEMYPQEVSHLVLMNSSFSSLSPFYHRLKPKNYFKLLLLMINSSPDRIEKFIMKTTSNDEKKWQPHFKKIVEFQKNHPVSLTNFIRQLKLSGQTRFKTKPSAEVLILNSRYDRLVNCLCSEAISKSWGHCPLETHPTAGHDLPLDDNLWILKMIQKWFT